MSIFCGGSARATEAVSAMAMMDFLMER